MIAFLLISTERGSEEDVGESLMELESIKNVHLIYGDFDIIAKVDVEDTNELQDFIMSKVRPIRGIERTDTLITTT